MKTRVLIASSPQFWIDETVQMILQAADQAISQRGQFSFVLSGGSTPQPVYQALARPDNAVKLDWSRTHIFWGDERVVPPDHPDSNYRMAKLALLDHVPLRPENIYRIQGELPPEKAAADYQNQIQTYFAGLEERFDLMLLGLGTDGHTASLFPDSEALKETQLWAAPNYARSQQAWRITLTYPALLNARQIIFLVSGGTKAAVTQQVIQQSETQKKFPAARVAAKHPNLTWVLDQEAAELL